MADEPELIDGLYQWRSTIATGNQTQIGEVIEQGTGRHLAMKLVIEGKTETKEAKASLKAEAAIAKNFEHPNIIAFEKFSSSRDATYMVMEFFRAANVKAQLKSELASLHSRAQPLLEGVCLALVYLHEKGWVHRDLKPENVLANRTGEVKLIDFSLSSRYSTGITKMLGIGGKKKIQGTRTYIAPETILRRPASPQTDIYSLGVMFFEILTGKTPFQGFTPSDLLQKHLTTPPPLPSYVNENLTPEVDQLLLHMLKKKPKERPQSVNEIYMELRRIKLFKHDVMQLQAARDEEVRVEKLSVLAKVDSRTDHERSEMLRANPELAAQFEAERVARAEKRRPKRRLASKSLKQDEAASAPAMPPMMPQPMMHPMMMPHPGMPPGYPPPGYPYMQPGPQGMPNYPQQPLGTPQPQQPAPAAIAPAPQAAPAAPVAPANLPAAAPTTTPPTDLEFMTELPKVV